jgi:hypothetical protein
MRSGLKRAAVGVIAAVVATVVIGPAVSAAPPAFSIAPLVMPEGGSEPAVTIGAGGKMAVDGLRWNQFGINLWTGPFGSTPSFRGSMDLNLLQPGRTVLGGGDGDIDIGSTGTLHEAGLDFIANGPCLAGTGNACRGFQLGVSATTCAAGFASLADCHSTILDTTGADRQWITSDGRTVYLSYHDARNSSLIKVWRSDDDGDTWQKVGDPIVAQGSTTGQSTFNNIQGPLVADPTTHDVFAVYIAGEIRTKCCSAAFNNVFVSRSSDGGQSWTPSLVFHAPPLTDLANIFPALAVDPLTGRLYAAWSDAHAVSLSSSADHGSTWSAPTTINTDAATTPVFPWIAARGGSVDVVYYATSAASKDDPAALWNVYLAKSTGGPFVQMQVSSAPNHQGAICTGGSGCAANRQLLDLFEVALDPGSLKAAVMFTDDKSVGSPSLPQVVLAQEK